MQTAQLTKLVIAALEDMKAINIEVIDVAPLTTLAEHMVICTGNSNRHVKALADSVMEKAREAGVRTLNAQGLEQGEWALVDLNGTIVHVLQASARATYQLEKLWDMGQPKPRLEEPAKPKAPAPKPAAKPAAKKPATKKPAAKAASPQKQAAKKSLTKPVAKKAAVKKAAAKKPAAKKSAVKKAAPSKPAANKAPLKKPAAKKAVAKKVVAKKAAPKKPATKAKRR